MPTTRQRQVVTATFTGAEDSISLSWSPPPSSRYRQHLLHSVKPTDGSGARVTIGDETSTGANVYAAARFAGTVDVEVLHILDESLPLKVAAGISGPFPTLTGAAGTALGVIPILPFYLPSDVTSVVIKIGNRPWYPATVDDFASNLALYASDGAGNPTGTALATWSGETVPGDGTMLVLSEVPVTRGSDGKVVLCYSIGAAITGALTLSNIPFGSYKLNSTVVSPAPTADGPSGTTVCNIHLSYLTERRRLIVLGDSLSNGYGVAFEGSAWYKLGTTQDWSVDIIGIPARMLIDFADYATNVALWDMPAFDGADVYVQAGVNDLSYNTLATMQTAFTTVVNRVRALGAAKVYSNTLAPQTAYPDTQRAPYNAWLLSQVGAGLDLDGVVDLAAAQSSGGLAGNGTPNALHGAYDLDGTHWTQAGHDAARAKILTVI